MVRDRRRDLWRQPGGIYELRPNWLLLAVPLVVIFLVSLVMLVSVSYSSSTDNLFIVGIFLVVMLAAVVSILATSVWRVRLEGDQLTVRLLTGEQRLQANEIGDICLDVVRAGRSGRIPVIKIITRQGKTSTLRGQFIDAPNLYCVLRTWWEDKRTTVG